DVNRAGIRLIDANGGLRLVTENAVGAELRQRVALRQDRLLDQPHMSAAPVRALADQELVVERGLQRDVAGEARGGEIVTIADRSLQPRRLRAAALLQRVRELVRKQPVAGPRAGSVVSCGKHDVTADRVRLRVNRARRSAGALVGMNPYRAEVGRRG